MTGDMKANFVGTNEGGQSDQGDCMSEAKRRGSAHEATGYMAVYGMTLTTAMRGQGCRSVPSEQNACER